MLLRLFKYLYYSDYAYAQHQWIPDSSSLTSGMTRFSRASALPQMIRFRVKRCLLLLIKNLCYPGYPHALTSMDTWSAPFGKLSTGLLASCMTKLSRASTLSQMFRCLLLLIKNLCYPDYPYALTSMDTWSAPFGKLSAGLLASCMTKLSRASTLSQMIRCWLKHACFCY